MTGSGVGRSHGTSRTTSFDRWFRYPAGFAADYVGMLLDEIGVTEGTVTDCFTGSGVTGTAARQRGLNFTGIEAHPLIAELAALKLRNPTPSPNEITVAGLDLSDAAEAAVRVKHERDISEETSLVIRSFLPATLLALLELRDRIKKEPWSDSLPYLKWALLGTLRDVAAVKVGWPYQRPGIARVPKHPDVFLRFKERLRFMTADISGLDDRAASFSSVIVRGDSRSTAAWRAMPTRSQACISSPPYLNNFDYADATRLELYFWGEVRTWRDMCIEVRSDMITATTQQSSKGDKLAAIDILKSDDDVPSRKVIGIVDDLARLRSERTGRPKEYDQVVPSYFVAMKSVLKNLFNHLEPGSPALWLIGDSAPYGVYIDTPALIGAFAQEQGFELKEDVALRQRGDRWSTNTGRSQAKLSERALVLHRP
ncbi:hypothetical protein [uncultured Friedmanniella sp.]|uniref:hypothetical protein n=1 Tax=uncultured Friedmanniella sp. TaxID=335381 RepID=UPI0035CC4AE9